MKRLRGQEEISDAQDHDATRLLALSTVLVMVMATSCVLDRVHPRDGAAVDVSPYGYHPGFFSHPYPFAYPLSI